MHEIVKQYKKWFAKEFVLLSKLSLCLYLLRMAYPSRCAGCVDLFQIFDLSCLMHQEPLWPYQHWFCLGLEMHKLSPDN